VQRGTALRREVGAQTSAYSSVSSQAPTTIRCMDRASLEQLLGRGLSLAEIGWRFDLHEATVSYWVKKHGLQAANRAKHAARGGIPPAQLAGLVEGGMTIAEIAENIGCSKATVRHWSGKYGLSTRGGVGRRPRDGAREAREAGLAAATLKCPRHGEAEHVREPRGYFRCRRCRQEAVVRRRRKVKEIVVAEAGGRCRLCGYARCLAALEFHHVDPAEKQFGVAQYGAARSIERVRAEVRKCVLLCSNCHAEVETGFSSVSGIARNGRSGVAQSAERDPVKVKVVGSSPTPGAFFAQNSTPEGVS
jgi:transposase